MPQAVARASMGNERGCGPPMPSTPPTAVCPPVVGGGSVAMLLCSSLRTEERRPGGTLLRHLTPATETAVKHGGSSVVF